MLMPPPAAQAPQAATPRGEVLAIEDAKPPAEPAAQPQCFGAAANGEQAVDVPAATTLQEALGGAKRTKVAVTDAAKTLGAALASRKEGNALVTGGGGDNARGGEGAHARPTKKIGSRPKCKGVMKKPAAKTTAETKSHKKCNSVCHEKSRAQFLARRGVGPGSTMAFKYNQRCVGLL